MFRSVSERSWVLWNVMGCFCAILYCSFCILRRLMGFVAFWVILGHGGVFCYVVWCLIDVYSWYYGVLWCSGVFSGVLGRVRVVWGVAGCVGMFY